MNEYLITVGILMGINMISVMSFNLSVGFTGLINLGQLALFGFGAYASALLTRYLHLNVWLAIIVAAILTTLLGILMALPTLRLKKEYLALVMLGLTFILMAVTRNWISLTRGALGLPGTVKLFPSNASILAAVFAAVALSYLALRAIVKTELGLVLQAVRDDELSAAALGKNVFMYKTISLGISAFFAGLAGSLFVHTLAFLDPSVFDLKDLVLLLAMLIVGGLGSLEGSVAGVLAITLFTEPFRFIVFSPAVVGPLRDIIFSLLIIAVLIFRPRGILGKVDLQ